MRWPVDFFISPEQLVTEYIERLINFPGTLQVLDFADGKVRLVACARTRTATRRPALRELREHVRDIEARIVAIYRAGRRSARPSGETIIEDGDEVFFLAGRDYIRRVMTRDAQG